MACYRPSLFSNFAKWTSHATGHPLAFALAVLVVGVWGVTGPLFGFSDTWQLVINTGTTIATFLMVFLLQHTQNRDSAAIQLKLDELIRSTRGAHNALLDLEELTEDELCRIRDQYEDLARKARERLQLGEEDTDTQTSDGAPLAASGCSFLIFPPFRLGSGSKCRI